MTSHAWTLDAAPPASLPAVEAAPVAAAPVDPLERDLFGGWGWIRERIVPDDDALHREQEFNPWLARVRRVETRRVRPRREAAAAWILALASPLLGLAAAASCLMFSLLYSPFRWTGYSAFGRQMERLLEATLAFCALHVVLATLGMLAAPWSGIAARRRMEKDAAYDELAAAPSDHLQPSVALRWLVVERTRWFCRVSRLVVIFWGALLLPWFANSRHPLEYLVWAAAIIASAAWLTPTWAAGCHLRASAAALADPRRYGAFSIGRDAIVGACWFAFRCALYLPLAFAAVEGLRRGIPASRFAPEFYRETLALALAVGVAVERLVAYRRLDVAEGLWKGRAAEDFGETTLDRIDVRQGTRS